jgi:hypothetical protein
MRIVAASHHRSNGRYPGPSTRQTSATGRCAARSASSATASPIEGHLHGDRDLVGPAGPALGCGDDRVIAIRRTS